MRKIDTVVVHQTGTPQTAGNNETLEAIRRYHKTPPPEGPGFRDIGYHQVIMRDGTVMRGRLDRKIGAHVAGHNATSIGICCVGAGPALPIGEGYMTQAQWDSLLRLCRQYQRAYGIPYHRVRGHREFPAVHKTCPGFDVANLRRVLR